MIGSYLRTTADLDFDVFSGTANTLFPAMMMGATGGIVSLAASSSTMNDPAELRTSPHGAI